MPELSIESLTLSEAELDTVKKILAAEVPNISVLAFGSRVKGNPRKYSDLDLALLTHTPLSLSEIARLKDAFDSSNLVWPVDITDWATTSERFRAIINENFIRIQ
jgi:predicted nucleotidyltransferase